MFGKCQVCHQAISEDRLSSQVIICDHCGASQSGTPTKRRDQNAISFMKIAVTLTFIASALFYHTTQWGPHSFSILPTQAMQAINIASAEQSLKLAQASVDRGRPHKAIEALSTATVANSDLKTAHFLLGELNFKMDRHQEAMAPLEKYIELGGDNLLAHMHLAQIYAKNNWAEKSTALYEKILNSRPDVFQITVAKNYVSDLIKMGQIKKAIRVIRKIQKLGTNTEGFMDYQLNQLKKQARNSRASKLSS